MSDSITLTGAFMQAVFRTGRRWNEDLWYSDFDNKYPGNVWGVEVTSFIQDYEALTAAAMERLAELLDGGGSQVPEHKLIFPLRRNGDT
jgi:DNA-binding LacI/PurR family transcriptional regulator